MTSAAPVIPLCGEVPSNAEAFNILIVDDNLNNLFTLNALLQQFPECSVIQARSGEEALLKTLQYPISLILLDVQMPVMDGFET
ncbi:MAG: response regulator, partial [Methylococcaceae bacterium]